MNDLDFIKSSIDRQLSDSYVTEYAYDGVARYFSMYPEIITFLYSRWSECDSDDDVKVRYAVAATYCLPIREVIDWLYEIEWIEEGDLMDWDLHYCDENGNYEKIEAFQLDEIIARMKSQKKVEH